jgi:hypothetical protein
MIVSRESRKGTGEGDETKVVPISKVERKKRPGTSVCIRRGKLLFLPTAGADVLEKAPSSPDDTQETDSKAN